VPNLQSGLGAALLLVAQAHRLPAQLLLLPSLSDRPEGIYDPIPASRLASPESPLMQALQRANAKDLRWPGSWSYAHIASGQDRGWAWKRRQERLRLQKDREARGIEGMYL
jgi:hypothetical protein